MNHDDICKPISETYDFVAIDVSTNISEDGIEIVRYDNFVRNLMKADTEAMMALHAGLGVAGEAGELADAIKREYIYKKPRDLVNIVEELGDLEWYMQAVRNHYGLNRATILQHNADKLSKRYVNLKYSDEAAIARADKNGSEASDA